MSEINVFFRPLSALYGGDFRKLPAPERLLLKCQAVQDTASDGLEATASDMRRRAKKVIDRAERWGLVDPPQAAVLRRVLTGEIPNQPLG